MFPGKTKGKNSTRFAGILGEDYARHLLLSKGYRIIETNFRSHFGEIDVIAVKDEVLVFVEVKTRWSEKFGKPEEAVTPRKLYRIKKTAEYYCLLHPAYPEKLRIDVVAIEVRNGKVISAKIINVD